MIGISLNPVFAGVTERINTEEQDDCENNAEVYLFKHS